MKKFFLLALATCISMLVFAQDDLILKIPSNPQKTTLQFGSTTITGFDNVIDPVAGESHFKIDYKGTAGLQVLIRATTLEQTPGDTIKDFSLAYLIKEDMLRGTTDIALKPHMEIVVLDRSGKPILDPFQFSYKLDKGPKDNDTLKGAKPTGANYGHPIFDAVLLANANTPLLTKLNILKYYAKNADRQDLDSIYKDNKFLEALATGIINAKISEGKSNGISAIFSSIGGLDVTTIADGFAKFIVKRTKQELSIAFFDKFKTYLDKYPDLKTVFPQSYRALTLIGDEIYNYQAYLQTLRECFENDLSTLDENLPSILDNHPDFFAQHPELSATLLSSTYISGKLADKVHPGDILNDYPSSYLDSLNKNWSAAIKTIQLVSASLRDTAVNTDSIYWVKSKQIKQVIGDSNVFKIYLGLLYQEAKYKYDNIHFQVNGKDTTLTSILNALAPTFSMNHQAYKDFILRFADKTDRLSNMINTYRKPASDSLEFEQYYKYFKASIDLIQFSTEISKLPYLKQIVPNLADTLKVYFEVAHSSADMVLDVKRRNYASAVTNAVHIYDLVKARYSLSQKQREKNNKKVQKALRKTDRKIVKEFVSNVSKGGEEVLTGDDVKKKHEQALAGIILDTTIVKGFKDDTLRSFYKYGTFMATLVQAKTSDDVANTIEAFAMPTGSSRVKRVSDFNVSVNAYTGLFYGVERIRGVDSGCWKGNAFGVTAPIGVAASWGHKFLFINTGKHEWSTSLFITLVDLGAVAAFRFRDDSTAQVPTIQLKDIFSPGAFLSIGIPKSPLSVNFGTQMGPNLRKVNSTGVDLKPSNDYSNKIYWRFSASVCVDIPLFNLFTRSK